ncbi:lysophospholipid acyltransferase family protein [Clostridium ihumii]|uniref:lysophospholipid acyltransferase family protein n=1 Tax=Clostridium ihumii TaxID=1470356 RepID=UPI0005911B7C|nr:lysophospholipid acyltransferase family protein [Clostridium ihumii]
MDLKHQLALVEELPKDMREKVLRSKIEECCKTYGHLKINGEENLKGIEGPIIFISNHLSNSDGMFLDIALKEYKPVFVAGEKLSKNHFTNLVLDLVERVIIKPNSADKDAIAAVINTLKSGRNIMIFPEGTRSRTCEMIEAKKGIILIAKLSKATIVPVGITGTEKFMPINKNEMESEEICEANVELNVGKPFKLPAKEKDEDRNEYHERALWEIMTSVSTLLPEEYQGFYKINK